MQKAVLKFSTRSFKFPSEEIPWIHQVAPAVFGRALPLRTSPKVVCPIVTGLKPRLREDIRGKLHQGQTHRGMFDSGVDLSESNSSRTSGCNGGLSSRGFGKFLLPRYATSED